MLAVLKDNRRRDMAIECKRCGGSTMLETVIKLRRGLFGFSETRSQRAYCATCKLSGSIENAAGIPLPIAINDRSRPSISGFLALWLRVALGRSGCAEWV
jgi:hypothetical protein